MVAKYEYKLLLSSFSSPLHFIFQLLYFFNVDTSAPLASHQKRWTARGSAHTILLWKDFFSWKHSQTVLFFTWFPNGLPFLLNPIYLICLAKIVHPLFYFICPVFKLLHYFVSIRVCDHSGFYRFLSESLSVESLKILPKFELKNIELCGKLRKAINRTQL